MSDGLDNFRHFGMSCRWDGMDTHMCDTQGFQERWTYYCPFHMVVFHVGGQCEAIRKDTAAQLRGAVEISALRHGEYSKAAHAFESWLAQQLGKQSCHSLAMT